MGQFKYFVIFAEMRTGSNLLEASLQALDGVECHGELFNPHFIGGPNRKRVFGMSLEEREQDPVKLLTKMRNKTDGISGFRLFHDHDPRIIEHVIADPACAKVVLTRSPLDAYVSRKIAGVTGQWRLGDVADRKEAQIEFDAAEFSAYLDARAQFQQHLRHALQAAGQTAFHVTYEDLQDLRSINGLAAYLGVPGRLERFVDGPKKQNPSAVLDKVKNKQETKAALKGFDWFDLAAAPVLEQTRGPRVPDFVAIDEERLLYLPCAGVPDEPVREWLGTKESQGLRSDFTQSSLNEWLKEFPDRCIFSVVAHPVHRAYAVFWEVIQSGGTSIPAHFGVVPSDQEDPDATREALLNFLRMIEANMSGQTSLPTPREWASQHAILQGQAEFVVANHSLKLEDLLAGRHIPENLAAVKLDPSALPNFPVALEKVYDNSVEQACRRAYRRDYIRLGYGDWA